MRSAVSDRIALLVLAGLAILSLWIKGVAHPAEAGPPPGSLERAIAARLVAHGFAVEEQRLPLGSLLVEARRGPCRLVARDAAIVAGSEANLAAGTGDLGPIRYLYRGRQSARRPALRMRVDRVLHEAVALLGRAVPAPAAVALAASPGCGGDTFGLADIRLLG